ncbi:Uma2 family endonuclease [Lusitaniella coriacea LEGE 07157]|uniref:Uma2 family endonuclease n=1 Tax=Lusitaniella coriacea LEGE 07157 TaxID=945747 RepID=A0A8J7B8U7_9CYAN|nr:Uma2 family endonuclease [Lusitaniella coriacea]MBE9115183.1 Uma2 family endonuclease [Lusitaniella coriacea LEGE 07157]
MVRAPNLPESSEQQHNTTFTLYLPRNVTLAVTQEQFETLAQVNRDLRLERNTQGELIVNPPTGSETGHRNVKIAYQVVKWVEEGGGGVPFDSSTGFILPNGATRSPDVAWIAQDRWDKLTPEEREGFAPLCPDFVVELRSKSDAMEPLRRKMREYIANGTRLGWLLDRKNRRVEVYPQGRAVEVLENPKTLSGEDILPGFVLQLKGIW